MSIDLIEQSVLSPGKEEQSNYWKHPISLHTVLKNESPYPFDALPNILRQVVNTYQMYGQQPLPLVSCSALANLSLACQALANEDFQESK